jgi:hypothetical protein
MAVMNAAIGRNECLPIKFSGSGSQVPRNFLTKLPVHFFLSPDHTTSVVRLSAIVLSFSQLFLHC